MKANVNAAALLRALKACLKHASTDATRPHLNAVLVEASAERFRCCATDGHRLIRYDLPPPSDAQPGTALLPRDVAERFATTLATTLKLTLKGLRAETFAELHVVDKLATLSGPGCSTTGDVSSETFPPYAQVIPEYAGSHEGADASGACRIDPSYLTDALAACAALPRGGRGTADLTIRGTLDTMTIASEYAGESVLVVLMPQRY